MKTFTQGGKRLDEISPNANKPIVSVITFCKNSKKTLQKTINSIKKQTYSNLEYIIIDGLSNDGTIDLLNANDDYIDYWLSEPDNCATEAQNKGLSEARGEYIMFINSDEWIQPNYIENAINCLLQSNADFVFGNVNVYEGPRLIRVMYGRTNYRFSLRFFCSIPTPCCIYHRRCFDKAGIFDETIEIGSDYEWLLRADMNGIRGVYNPDLFSNFLIGGKSWPTSIDTRAKLPKKDESREFQIKYGALPTPFAYMTSYVMWMRSAIPFYLRLILPSPLFQFLQELRLKISMIIR